MNDDTTASTRERQTGTPPRPRVVHSLVPEGAPVRLVDYYPEFESYYPEAELQTKRWFVRNIAPDWTILDIGANVGIYSVLFGRAAPEGRVHAFEPTSTAAKLRRNLGANSIGNVSIHEIALGNRVGSASDRIYRMWGSAPEEREYEFTTVDAFVRQQGIARVDLIKIDVDGFDFEVLQGARETLLRDDPFVMIELNHALATRNQSVGEALTWLIALGYGEARIFDQENYLLRRGKEPRSRTTAAMALEFDTEPMLLPSTYAPGRKLDIQFAGTPVLHRGTSAAAVAPGRRFTIPGPRWGFGAEWRLPDTGAAGPAFVIADIEVRSGAVAIGALDASGTAYVGREEIVSASPGTQRVRVFIPDVKDAHSLMMRNADLHGDDATFVLGDVFACEAAVAPIETADALKHHTKAFFLEDIAPGDVRTGSPSEPIEIVPVDRLAAEVGFGRPYVPEILVYRHGLADFNTERDETALYRYIYRELRPRRHLEFGTWEGHGAAVCAESCDAEIWTINLPEGEKDAAGAPLYSATGASGSDAGDRIGWRYRAAGHAGRVHQLLGDSRDLDVGQFGAGFFDTALVDGGHTPDVMASDTDKAIHLVRSGGWIIWHDFCPDPSALRASEAGRGVVTGFANNHHRWKAHFRRIFWLRPSWLLVGIRK